MQLYANSKLGQPIAATEAEKHCDYHCLECAGPVRLRGGPHRQSHFYHLGRADGCRQNGKTLVHLQAQCWIQLQLDNCQLERRFPDIGRVADVVWEAEKIVFEVQCSPITAAEVEQRNRDYLSQGYQVVWLLHDERYNGNRLSAAELYLRNHPCYFICMDRSGRGRVYDQFERIEKGVRTRRLSKLTVDLASPHRNIAGKMGLHAMKKKFEYRLCFAGDLIDLYLMSDKHPYILEALKLENQGRTSYSLVDLWRRWIARPYIALLQALLEKANR